MCRAVSHRDSIFISIVSEGRLSDRLVHLGIRHRFGAAVGPSQLQAHLDCKICNQRRERAHAEARNLLGEQAGSTATSHQVPALLRLVRLRKRHLLLHAIWYQILFLF